MYAYQSALTVMFLSLYTYIPNAELSIDLFIQQIIKYIKKIKTVLEGAHHFDLRTYNMHIDS